MVNLKKTKTPTVIFWIVHMLQQMLSLSDQFPVRKFDPLKSKDLSRNQFYNVCS